MYVYVCTQAIVKWDRISTFLLQSVLFDKNRKQKS